LEWFYALHKVIATEHARLGHSLGWRLFTSAVRNIESAKIALVTINPGGAVYESPKFSSERGNAYAVEEWADHRAGQAIIQRQVRRMFDVMGEDLDAALSGYLVPFRSPNWRSLQRKQDSLSFGQQLWREIFQKSPATTVISFGKEVGHYLPDILDARFNGKHPSAWGTQTIDEYSFGIEGRLLILPHLSHFRLFGRVQSEAAFRRLFFRVPAQRPISDEIAGGTEPDYKAAYLPTIVNTGDSMPYPAGPYRIVKDSDMRRRAIQKEDPRHIFYETMLSSGTYDNYLRRVGNMVVQPATTSYPVSGSMEICYCLKKQWIADA